MDFNDEMAIKREQEIKAKVDAGEMTAEEAMKAYAEPVQGKTGSMLVYCGYNSLSGRYNEIHTEMSKRTEFEGMLVNAISNVRAGQVQATTKDLKREQVEHGKDVFGKSSLEDTQK